MQTWPEEKGREQAGVYDELFEHQTHARSTTRPRRTPSREQVRQARRYARTLGIADAPEVYLDGRHGWYRGDHGLGTGTLARALAGRYGGLAVAGLEEVGFITLDVDFGHAPPRPPKVVEISDFLKTPAGVRRRRRTSAAERKLLRRVRRAFPAVHWLPFASPNGLHLLALLAEPVAAATAATLGAHVLEVLGHPVSVEAFPTLEPRGARTCRLPGTGGRLLDETLEQRRHRLRSEDISDLLAAPRSELADFGFDPSRVVTNVDISGDTVGTPGFQRNQPQTRARPQLYGEDFAAAVLGYLTDGIGNDESFDAVGKLSFALRVGLDLCPERCLQAFAALLDRGGHGSTQAQTAAGRAQLLRVFRSTLRHHERGISAGTLEPGKLASVEVAAAVAVLLGDPVRRRSRPSRAAPTLDLATDLERKQRLTELRRAAATARWARQRDIAASQSATEPVECPHSSESNAVAPTAKPSAASARIIRFPSSTTSVSSSTNCSSISAPGSLPRAAPFASGSAFAFPLTTASPKPPRNASLALEALL